MVDSFRNLASQNHGRGIRNLLFFVLFFFYVWLAVDPRLIYHSSEYVTNFPVFYRTWSYFLELTPHPGGLVEYGASFISQFLYFSSAGALVLTLQAFGFFFTIDYVLKTLDAPRLRPAAFVAPILLLTGYAKYTYHFIETTAVLVALLSACLYLKFRMVNRPVRAGFFLALSVILYPLVGGAYFAFAMLCATYELFFARSLRTGLSYLLLAVVIPCVAGAFIFNISIVEAFTDMTPFSYKILSREVLSIMVKTAQALYLLLPCICLGLGIWRAIFPSPTEHRPRSKNPKHRSPLRDALRRKIISAYKSSPVLKWVVESAMLVAITGAVASYYHDRGQKIILESDYYASRRMWQQVLESYHRNSNSFFIVHDVNRALYHTGKLPYEMFAYHQHPDTLFLTSTQQVAANWKRADVYIDLGAVNMGEGALAEAIERLGERPHILRRLALINLVKGNTNGARVYLGALSKTLFDAGWANDYLARLDTDPNLSNDEEIQHLRSVAMGANYYFPGVAFTKYYPERVLLALLEKNRHNRMAFEYLMAWYMLTKQLDKFVANLDRLDNFDYPAIPRHYEEAILMYQAVTRGNVDLKNRQISTQTYDRAQGFMSVCSQIQPKNEVRAMYAAAPAYSDTYFFYFNFGHLGIIK
jgi:hypothetical protein